MRATTEAAFETLIVEHLVEHGGFVERPASAYDAALGLMTDDLLAYVAEGHPDVWAKQQKLHGDRVPDLFLRAFKKAVDQRGVLRVLREGLRFGGKPIRVATFRPAHGLNPAIEARYAANRLAVVRQVHHDPKAKGEAVDLVLFLNGIPVVTCELKNAMTGQHAEHARHQYARDRDPDAPLFRFKRGALVHFAVGSDEAWMTTRLARGSTFFLPFNRGHGTAAGNPPVPGKHRTAYVWEEVWERHSLLDLVARFIHLQVEEKEGADGKVRKKEAMIFPRYHQLDVVRKLVAAAREKGAGTHYLVQHSAGSGKSNSIAWLTHRLASLHDAQDRKVYDGVVVMTDRRVLDQQLQDTISQFDHVPGVVRRIEENQVKSTQLAEALAQAAPIIICTVHSFGAVADKLQSLPDRRYALVIDEAHSSQGGDLAKAVRDIIGIPDEEDEDESLSEADKLAQWSAERRKLPANLSYFAFTATPKFKTLCLYGRKVGRHPETHLPQFEPFHLYSMRQAIEEGFILDVLRGYTTYTRFFQLVKAIEDDPLLDKKKAARALARFVDLHPKNIEEKAKVMIEHFRTTVRGQLAGRAKAMVVTASRLHAVLYKLAFDAHIREHGYTDVGVLVAFSGEVKDDLLPGETFTEPGMNRDPKTGAPLKVSELPRAFDSDAYNVLIVANKYQTGFDQPRLVAMYVDKRLHGIQAVQTLSRLNRMEKGKEHTFVLDFVNDTESIKASFQQYYEGTNVLEAVDPQRFDELSSDLRDARVFTTQEVDRFAAVFFKPPVKRRSTDNARMNAALDPAVDRFKALEEDPREAFRGALQAYVNLYAWLAQVVYTTPDVEFEKLYVFGKMLLRKLPRPDGGMPVDLGDDVALEDLRVDRKTSEPIALAAEGPQPLYGPQATGTGGKEAPDLEPLSELIARINERLGGMHEVEGLLNDVVGDLVASDRIREAAQANDRANFAFVGGPAFDVALVERHQKHEAFIDGVFSEEAALEELRSGILDLVYRALKVA